MRDLVKISRRLIRLTKYNAVMLGYHPKAVESAFKKPSEIFDRLEVAIHRKERKLKKKNKDPTR